MNNFQLIYTIALSAYSYYLMSKVLKNTPKDCELTKNEKTQVIILLLLNTLISWVIFSFGWKQKLPTKTKQVNKYLRNILVTLLVIALVSFFLAIVLIAINPARQLNRY
jgi:glycerol uptake facilitator-like aquaporin